MLLEKFHDKIIETEGDLRECDAELTKIREQIKAIKGGRDESYLSNSEAAKIASLRGVKEMYQDHRKWLRYKIRRQKSRQSLLAL